MNGLVPLVPDWPAPKSVSVIQTTRLGGVSSVPFDSLNLGDHVGDDLTHVQTNRQRVFSIDSLLRPVWLKQVHGIEVLDVDEYLIAGNLDTPSADAAISTTPGHVCLVMTADCLPVLFCNRQATVVAAAHAGWRGLCDGVLEATVRKMQCDPSDILAWLGPAIGPTAFEVGEEVREAFVQHDPSVSLAFAQAVEPGKWLGNLFLLARQRLLALGITAIYGGNDCTFSQPERFFSYRREGQTGRMASAIWLDV